MDNQAEQSSGGITAYPSSFENINKNLASIASIIRDSDNMIPLLRREFRGEAILRHDDGTTEYIQVVKPAFIKIDVETEKPLKKLVKYKGQTEPVEIYIPNDEAIDTILQYLKFMGLNNITKLTNVKEDIIRDDLMEFECKLAAVLAQKQKAWGIDKAFLPMLQTQLKTIVQDSRYMANEGGTLKALTKSIQRIEQFVEGEKKSKITSPYS